MGIDPLVTPNPSTEPEDTVSFSADVSASDSNSVPPDTLDTSAASFLASGATTFETSSASTPSTISAKDFYSTTVSAEIAQNEQTGQEQQDYSLYYVGFTSSLANFLQRASFLTNNIAAFSDATTAVNAYETQYFGSNSTLESDAGTLNNDYQSVIPAAVDALNAAAEVYQQNGDLNAWNSAVSTYNNTINGLNLSSYIDDYALNEDGYNSQLGNMNSNISFINSYGSNFTPPLNFAPLVAAPDQPSVYVPQAPAIPGETIGYVAPDSFSVTGPAQIVPAYTPAQVQASLSVITNEQQVADYLLSQQNGSINSFNNKQQFGFRQGVPLNPANTQVDTSNSASSTPGFATGSPDPQTQSKTLSSSITSDIVKSTTHSLGVSSGGTLSSDTGYLVSGLFQTTGIYSTRKALQLSGNTVGPVNLGEIDTSPGAEDLAIAPVDSSSVALSASASAGGSTAPSGQSPTDATSGATAAASFSESVAVSASTPNNGSVSATTNVGASAVLAVPQPPINNPATIPTAVPTDSELTAGVTTAAALATVNTANTVNGTSIVSTSVTTLVNSDPALASLAPNDKAVLANTISSSVSLDLSLTSLLSLSVALGTPGLIQQYAANVVPLQDAFPVTNNDSPLQTVITNPAYQAFIEASISNSLSSSLNFSQAQADSIAQTVVTQAAQAGNIQNAEQLSDLLTTDIQNEVVAQGVDETDAENAANQALSDLEDQQKFTAIQEGVIHQDQVADSISNSLIHAGINQNQAIELAARVSDENRDAYIKLAETTDQQEQAALKASIQANIENSLSQNVSSSDALAASQQAYNTVNTIGPANLAIQKANATAAISPEQLKSEISTLVAYNLSPLIGSQNATSQGVYFADQIVASNTSLRTQNTDHVNKIINSTNNQNADTVATSMSAYLQPTTAGYVAAQNFMDPGKTVTHNALTGVMYSQPVAIKNTPQVVPV